MGSGTGKRYPVTPRNEKAFLCALQNTKSYKDRFSESYVYSLEPESRKRIGASSLTFHQQPKAIGTSVYTAAIAGSKLLEHAFGGTEPKIDGEHIIELGSGTGITGIVAATLGANMILTDIQGTVLDNLRVNVDTNSGYCPTKPTVAAFDWRESFSSLEKRVSKNSLQSLSGILAMEVIYYSECVDPLINTLLNLTGGKGDSKLACTAFDEQKTLEEICDSFPTLNSSLCRHWPKKLKGQHMEPSVLLGFDTRGREGVRNFLAKIQKWFDVTVIPSSLQHLHFVCDHVRFVILERKACKEEM